MTDPRHPHQAAQLSEDSFNEMARLLDEILTYASRVLNAEGVAVLLWDQPTNQLVISNSVGSVPQNPVGTTLPADVGISGQAFSRGEPLIVNSYTTWEHQRPLPPDQPTPEVAMALPFFWQGEPVGVMVLGRYKPVAFSTEDRYLAELFASQLAIVIGNARLSEAERISRQQIDALLAVTRTVSSKLDEEEVLQTIINNMARVLPIGSGAIVTFDEGTSSIRAHYRLTEAIIHEHRSHDLLNSPVIKRIMATRRPLLIENTDQEHDWVHTPATAHIKGWLGVPLILNDELIGLIMVDAYSAGTLNETHVTIAEAMAAQTAITLEKARLYRDELEARHRIEALLKASQALSQELETEALYQTIIDSAGLVLPYIAASLLLFENAHTQFIAFRGYEDLPQEEQQALYDLDLADSPILARLRTEKTPITIGDVHNHPDWITAEGGERIKSFMAIPLMIRGEVRGALMLDGDEIDQFGPEHVEIARAFGTQAAVAIENASLVEQLKRNLLQAKDLHTLSQNLLAAPSLRAMLEVVGRPFFESDESGFCVASLSRITRHGEHIDLRVLAQVFSNPLYEPVEGRAFILRPGAFIQTGQVTIIPDIQTIEGDLPLTAELLDKLNVRAVAICPLTISGEVGGLITISWGQPRQFSSQEIQRLNLIGPQLSAMFENQLLLERTTRNLMQTEATYAGSRRMVNAIDEDGVLAAIAETGALANFERCLLIGFISGEGGSVEALRLQASHHKGEIEPLADPGTVVPLSVGLLPGFVNLPEPEHIIHLPQHQDLTPQERAMVMEHGLETSLYLPMKAGNKPIGGVLALSTTHHPLEDGQIHHLATLVSQATVVIQNIRLLDSTEKALQQAQTLYAASRAMAEADTPLAILEAFASHAFESGAAWASFYMGQAEGEIVLEAITGADAEATPPLLMGQTYPLPAALREMFYTELNIATSFNVADLPPDLPAWATVGIDRMAAQTITIIPMLLGDVTGAVLFTSSRPATHDTAFEQYYGTLSPHFATLIKNSRLLRETRLARRRFEDVVMNVSDAMWEIDIKGQFTYLAGGLIEAMGYTLDDLLGQSLRTVIHPVDYKRLLPRLQGDPFKDYVHRLKTQRGHYRWHEASATPMFNEDGQLTGYRGVTRDVHQAQLAKQREQTAAEIATSLTTMLSLDDLLRHITRQLAETLGYYHVYIRLLDHSTHELVIQQEAGVGDNILKGTLPRISQWRNPLAAARAANELKTVVVNNTLESRIHLPNPNLPRVRSEAALPLFRGDRLLGVLVVYDDKAGRFTEAEVGMLQGIAAQASIAVENARLYQALESQAAHLELLVRERTAEIAKERERIQTIVENTGDGVMLLSDDGAIEYANDALADIVGMPRTGIIGTVAPLRTYLNRIKPRKRVHELFDVFRNKQEWQGTIRFNRPDGSAFDGHLKLSPVPDGDATNFVILLRDITAQKEVERMRKRFVENVSHELRTPIANIKLYQMLLASGPREKQQSYLETMNAQVLRLERLVEDLLDLSRIEQGRITIQLEWFDLNALLHEIFAMHRLQAEQRGITLNLHLDEDLPTTLGDRERLTQVVTNLLMNAINYTQVGDSIGVRTWEKDKHVMFTIWDTGIGIDPEHLPFIFNRFYRSQRAKDTGAHGTGLGLAIVKEIVEAHGGVISVESGRNRGTSFTISLPLTRLQPGMQE